PCIDKSGKQPLESAQTGRLDRREHDRPELVAVAGEQERPEGQTEVGDLQAGFLRAARATGGRAGFAEKFPELPLPDYLGPAWNRLPKVDRTAPRFVRVGVSTRSLLGDRSSRSRTFTRVIAWTRRCSRG